ncbi:hypothetical protein [Psychromonas aquimarina]|uniref:hypothetical protein n=1 Tax=Psychromonas aquimarina TaxID=444919 RepID=UPI00041F8B2B|nr:hypothetical protein [Psychromonas aquimarina]
MKKLTAVVIALTSIILGGCSSTPVEQASSTELCGSYHGLHSEADVKMQHKMSRDELGRVITDRGIDLDSEMCVEAGKLTRKAENAKIIAILLW